MQASTQLDSRRGHVPRGGSAACEHVARRWGHIGGRGAELAAEVGVNHLTAARVYRKLAGNRSGKRVT